MKKQCEIALAKLENLEKTVQMNRDRVAERKAAQKPSLMKRMEYHQKNDVPLQQAPAKSKNQEAVL